MSFTPDIQRPKRGLPSTLSTPAKKSANPLTKQVSVGQITNSTQELLARNKAKSRPSPGSKFPAKASALTPNAKKICQRNLKKSSSYCEKNIRSEDRKRIDSNFASFRGDHRKIISKSASKKTPLINEDGEDDRPTSKGTPVSLHCQKSVKTLFKGKSKRDEEMDKDVNDLIPSKRVAICSQERFCKNSPQKNISSILKTTITNSSPYNQIAEMQPRKIADDYMDIQDDDESHSSSSLPKRTPTSYGSPFKSSEDKKIKDKRSGHVDGDFSVHVAVRVRPLSEREKQNPDIQCVVEMYENSTCVTEVNGNTHHFTYDMSYWSFDERDPTYCGQDIVYQSSAQPLLDGVLEGYNTCLFAYGQTGSGKSYSMMGYPESGAGVIPRFCQELFERINETSNLKFTVEISFFEIYNEKIHDLLFHSQECKKQLRVREHPEQGPYVQDLSMFTVRCYKDIEVWLAVGNKNRATAATGMNDKSSRSHSVFTISLQNSQGEYFEGSATQLCRNSKVHLVDLAGSEKAKNVTSNESSCNQEATNSRLKEGSCINKSLHTLGKVISLLSEQQTGSKKKIFVPYRDSVLTWLLKESLGGNSRTAMIATISPANVHVAETLSTLRYARQARNIVNQVRVNEDSNSKMIRELLCEIDRLKSMQNPSREDGHLAYASEIEMLRSKLKETKELLSESTRIWQEKLKLSQNKQKQEAERLRRSGVAFKVDNTLPNLVNLNEDPMLSDLLVYVLKEGKTTFGNSESQHDHDIKLNGPLVADYHCFITYELKQVRITPVEDALTYVNGEQVSANSLLRHGDRIVIGGTHFFGFNQPISCKSAKREGRKKWDGLTLKDFEFAKKELVTQQNEKLEAELEDSQMKAQEGLINLITNAKATSEKQMNLQKQKYEEEISSLQKLLVEAEEKKRIAEENQLCAEDRITELNSHKQALVEDIWLNRTRLQDEAKVAKQALDETKANQLEIISELEREKQRIEGDVFRLKSKKAKREIVRNEIRSALSSVNEKDTGSKRDLLKIALLLREANKVSEKLGKFITFSRDDILENDKVEIRIRLNDTKFGKTTLWSLEKFEFMVGKMRELYRADGTVEEDPEDPFNDPEDDWVEDFVLDSPTTPEPSGSRMFIKRRQSLDHSLTMLTNLNSSLSELAARRRSSMLGTSQALVSIKESEEVSPLAVLKDILEEYSPTIDDAPVCGRLFTMVADICTECLYLQKHRTTKCQKSKSVLKMAMLFQSLKEAFSTWRSMQKGFDNATLQRTLDNFSSFLAKLFTELKILVKVAEEGYCQLDGNIEKMIIIMHGIMKLLGALSLCAVDAYSEQQRDFSKPEKKSNLWSLFMDGQKSFLDSFFNEQADFIRDLVREIKDLKLENNPNCELERHLLVLNSSGNLIQKTHEFMVSWHSAVKDDEFSTSFAWHQLHQRHLIGNVTKFAFNLEKLTLESRNSSAGYDIVGGIIHNVSDELENVLQNASTMNRSITIEFQKGHDTNLRFFDNAYRQLEFAATSLHTSVESLLQNNNSIFKNSVPRTTNAGRNESLFCPVTVNYPHL